jgi:hypothetical protein
LTELAARLSALAIQRLEAAHLGAAGLEALAELAQVLDPGRRLTTWALAQAIEAHLERFSSAAYPRISRGGREPRNHAERAMALYLAAGLPRSDRRIWDLLA